jgi:hypothetical protein
MQRGRSHVRKANCFGIGMCIQNHRGLFVKAATTWHEGKPLPREAEAIGLRDAISWLGRLSKVHIELDCKLVVDNIFFFL